VRNVIREGKFYQIPSLMQTHTTSGMVTMEQSLMSLYRNGAITREALLQRTNDPAVLEKLEEERTRSRAENDAQASSSAHGDSNHL
jgi:twitching motility protein PilT